MDFVVLPRSICNATGPGRPGRRRRGLRGRVRRHPELQKFVDELQTASPAERAQVLSRVLDPDIDVA